MTTPELTRIPVRSPAELTQRWGSLLDPPVFGARSLWLAWFDGTGRQLPVVVPLDQLPAVPDPRTLAGLRLLHDTVVDQTGMEDGHLAMALCRPGRPTVTAGDDDWAEALREELDGQLDGTWSLHLAADGRIVPLVHGPG